MPWRPISASGVSLRPSHCAALSALLVLGGTIGFAAARPDYRQVTQTISELGAVGAVHARLVGFAVFLPSGLLSWLALAWVRRCGPRAELVLWGLSTVGVAYVGAAFFPCDPGSPLWGSPRQLVHNLVGASEYLGTGFAFFALARSALRDGQRGRAVGWSSSGALVWLGLVLLGTKPLFPVRGAVQRVVEAVVFVGTYCAVATLEREASRARRGRSLDT